MENKIPGKYYLVEVPGWNESGFAIAVLTENANWWTDTPEPHNVTAYVKSYKALDKVGRMHPFAVLTFKNT